MLFFWYGRNSAERTYDTSTGAVGRTRVNRRYGEFEVTNPREKTTDDEDDEV
jgi:hypothetical protein